MCQVSTKRMEQQIKKSVNTTVEVKDISGEKKKLFLEAELKLKTPKKEEIHVKKEKVLWCLFNTIGVPLLTRTSDVGEMMPLPLLGLFSAIHTSSGANIVPISNILSETSSISYNLFDNNLLMVLVERFSSWEGSRKSLLEFMYDMLVLFVGNTDLSDGSANDKLSRLLRVIKIRLTSRRA